MNKRNYKEGINVNKSKNNNKVEKRKVVEQVY